MTTLRAAALVFVGGAVGGTLRLLIGQAIPADAGHVPWAIVAINLVGSAVLGFVVARGQARVTWRLFPLIGPGLLGGFTTFSSLAALTWATDVSASTGLIVLAATMIGCVLAAAGGWALGWIEAEREIAVEQT